MPEYLFAYGTLRRGFGLRLAAGLEYVGEGRIEGRMYDLGAYPGAVALAANADGTASGAAFAGDGHEIEGDVFMAPESLAAFDEYEGDEFVRKRGRVKMMDKVVEAWIYWYNGDVSGRSPIKDKDYLNYLKSIKPK